MFRRIVYPILRFLLALFIMGMPLLLAAIAQADEPTALVTLRGVALADRPSGPARGARLPPSAPATLLEKRDGRFLVSGMAADGGARGWADAGAFLILDDPAVSLDRLLEKARFQLGQAERPVLTAALLAEVVRRDPASVEGWRLLGEAGIRIAETSHSPSDGEPSMAIELAGDWGLRFLQSPDGKSYRYDGEAFRRLIALNPAAEIAEEARVKLLTRCGPVVDPRQLDDLAAAQRRERDLGELLASFPASPRRLPLLLERARLLAGLAERAFRRGESEAFQAYRESAIEAASEVSASSAEPARRRAADRLVTRLAKSFPRRTDSEKPVISSTGLKAAFVTRSAQTLLVVTRPDGKDAIQPFPVSGADAASLAFDPTGTRLVWDEAPSPGHRRTRLLDLMRARLTEPAASAEPELLVTGGASAAGEPDRYTTFLGFSPDGRNLLVVSEGFAPDGTRIPRHHFLCDVEGRRPPVLVERPFSAPGTVDWARIAGLAEKLSG